jgi:hypothetical protein
MKIPAAAVVCALSMAVPAAAQDASGTWDVTFNTPTGPRPATMTIRKDGEKLAGSIGGPQGEVAFEGTQKGPDVSIAFSVKTNDGTFNISLTGKQDGDSLAGMADYAGAGQGEWSAKRQGGASQASGNGEKGAIDVSGPWTLQVETGAGSVTPTVTFKQEGEKLTGQYSGQFGESALTGALNGADITFSIDVNFQGNTIRVVYAGTVEKDAMKGKVTFGELGEGTFSGRRK